MTKIAIVTDSTSAFPLNQVGDVPVRIVPLDLHWDAEEFKDGVDLSAAEFYRALPQRRSFPSTSRPSPKTFIRVYKELLAEGYSILSIHLSAAFSGTYEGAVQAKRILGTNPPILLHDSASVSTGTSLQILAAADAIKKGADLQECGRVLEQARDHCQVYFTVSTLKYLIRGGRLRWAAGAAANLFGIRPILTIREGQLHVARYAVSSEGARRKLVNMVTKELVGTKLRYLGAAYTDDAQLALQMRERVAQNYGILVPKDALLVPLSPVVGAYTGPGAFGIAFINQ